jgi:hypothetical protein
VVWGLVVVVARRQTINIHDKLIGHKINARGGLGMLGHRRGCLQQLREL